MLGHVSAERNRPELIRGALAGVLRRAGLLEHAAAVQLAPRRGLSDLVVLPAAAAPVVAAPRRRPEQLRLFG
jgi:hypothetical protein